MSEFVNYQKRGIELPLGCKDLIDVLPPPREARIPAEGLAHIERYLSRLLQSPTGCRSVWICSFTIPLHLSLVYSKGLLRALIFLTTEREEPVRAVLSRAGILPTQDNIMGGDGPFSRFLLCSLPADVARAERFVSELLRSGYGLPEDVLLDFRYDEKDAN
jgi:hypothetical protein